MYCETYTQSHKTLLPQTILLIMTHPTARFAVLTFFYKKYIYISSTTNWFSGKWRSGFYCP